MSSLIYYYIIFFVSFLINTSLHQSTEKDCITFETTQSYTINMCRDDIDNATVDSSRSLNCLIRENSVMNASTCYELYSLVVFTFPHNSIFEIFFNDNREIIEHLFRRLNISKLNSLHIVLESHNLTNITWAYLNSTLKTSSQTYNDLMIDFQQTNQNASQPEIGNDFYHTNLSQLKLFIPCRYGSQKISYELKDNFTKFQVQEACQNQTTTIPTTTANTTVTITPLTTALTTETILNINSTVQPIIANTTTNEITTTPLKLTTVITSTDAVIQSQKTTQPMKMTEQTTTSAKSFVITTEEMPSNTVEQKVKEKRTANPLDIVTKFTTNTEGRTMTNIMNTTTPKITLYITNITLSSTKPSKKSTYLLLLYLLPILLLLLISITIIVMYIILRYHQHRKQTDIPDSSLMLGIPSTNVSMTKNNDLTSKMNVINSSTAFLSPSVKPINKTAPANPLNNRDAHTFDNTF